MYTLPSYLYITYRYVSVKKLDKKREKIKNRLAQSAADMYHLNSLALLARVIQ